MIISQKHKYIFIGLPFAASSAISKELLSHYGGVSLYHKHSNIPLLKMKQPDFPINDYCIFAVVRDPVEIMLSVYNKHLTNPYNTFTDPQYFIENGGFVSKKARNFYHRFKANKWSFEEFLNQKFKLIPYDNNLSVNKPYISRYIRFENLNDDFMAILQHVDITPVRELPLYNKTKKVISEQHVNKKTLDNVFGAFLMHNNAFYGKTDVDVPFTRKLVFNLLRPLRDRKVIQYDMRQANNRFSIQDLANER